MTNILFFDTETTGTPSTTPLPRLVQLALLLTDEKGNEIKFQKMLVKPNGFEIPRGAEAIHGISTETALEFGVDAINAVNAFIECVKLADIIIAHNYKFDENIMTIELKQFNIDYNKIIGDKFKECTQNLSENILKLPPTERMTKYGRHKYKSPKLTEVYQQFFNKTFDNHDAGSDTKACSKVFFHILKNYHYVIDEKYQVVPFPI